MRWKNYLTSCRCRCTNIQILIYHSPPRFRWNCWLLSIQGSHVSLFDVMCSKCVYELAVFFNVIILKSKFQFRVKSIALHFWKTSPLSGFSAIPMREDIFKGVRHLLLLNWNILLVGCWFRLENFDWRQVDQIPELKLSRHSRMLLIVCKRCLHSWL